MAPTLVTSTVYFVLCILFVTTNCTNICPSKDCKKKNACPLSCSCLGFLVDCAKMNLDKIPDDLPTWVQILDLQNNKIDSINDDALIDLKNLTELDLSQNDLTFINSTTLQRLPFLQKINFHSNRLMQIPDMEGDLSLTSLNLQHNLIRAMNSSVLEKLPNLRNLDLSFNSLTGISVDTFGYSSSLLHLSLSHNKIGYIQRGAFDNLTSLVSLKLNRNKLSSIPKELFRQMNTLQHLEINSNLLTTIEGLSFQGLTSLESLKLRHSSISHLLDGAFYGLNSIKKLQLDSNHLSKITKGWLYGLNSLQRLYLNHNNISVIEDDAWDSGKRLSELDLSNNKLEFITPKTFDKLYSLKKLILSNNKITYIEEGSFHSLSALQHLELKNNEISWTIEDSEKLFDGLERLRYLGLANNNIKSVKSVFTGLSRLEVLNLTENPITTIENNAFEDLLHLQTLLINTSSLLCDCNLSWMSRSHHFPITAKCGYPLSLTNKSVFDVLPDEFICEGLPKPIIEKEPMTKITLKGENVTLECQAKSSGFSEIKFHWRKDGKLLPSLHLWSKSTSVTQGNVVLHTSYLFIENIQDKDEGRYQCVVSNHFGSVYSNKARITVHVYPVFTKTPVDVAIKSGSTARLECGAKGQPQPDIAWKKDGGGEDFPAARERRMHVMLPTDDVFFIVGVKASDTGVYSCTAQNVAGVITANATLTVLETPSFVKKMENKDTKVGETAVLECRAAGNPKPKLTWTKDGIPLVITDRHFFTGDNQLLVIDLTKYSDSGEYTCEMSNTLGTERGTSYLKILPANAGEDNNTTGIIVISVVVCIVGTSLVWVIVIHRTRKPREDFVPRNPTPTEITPFTPYRAICPKEPSTLFLDSHSGHSKDSGTGDSTQPSNDDLLIEGDDQGLLLCSSKRNPRISHHAALQDSVSSNSISKEQVPLLRSFRTSHSRCKQHRKSLIEFHQSPVGVDWYTVSCGDTQRSMSVDHMNGVILNQRGSSEPPRINGTDSGFSTFPRSITRASVSHWNLESPQLHRLPKDVPNDSGSFSIASEDIQSVTSHPLSSKHAIRSLDTKIWAS